MEILERSPQRIVIKEKGYSGWPMALIAWLGFTILPLSLLANFIDMRAVKFSCRRIEPQQVDCQVDNQHWLGVGNVRSTFFPSVQRITKEEEETAEGEIDHSYFIYTKQGKFEFNYLFDNSQRNLIARFLENSEEPSIKIEDNTREVALFMIVAVGSFASFGFLVGLISLASAYKNKIYLFDEKNRKVRIQIEKHQKISSKEYAFSEIGSLDIRERSDEDGNFYSLSLKLTNGREIQVSSDLNKIEEIEEIAKSISDLLKINVSINPLRWSSELKRRAKQKSHPVYSSLVD